MDFGSNPLVNPMKQLEQQLPEWAFRTVESLYIWPKKKTGRVILLDLPSF